MGKKMKVIFRPRSHGKAINFKRMVNEANSREEAESMDMPTLCDCGKWVEHNDMVESPIDKGELICVGCKEEIEQNSSRVYHKGAIIIPK